jgi:hypothetical protein
MSDRRDPSSDPFLADLAAGFSPDAAGAAPSDRAPLDDPGGLAIRRDDELIVVQAWAPGPAGIASLALDSGLSLVVDAALPHRFVGATIIPPETPALRRLDPIVGTRAVDSLIDVGDTHGGWSPCRARPRETIESTAVGRYVLLADETERFADAFLAPTARAALAVELAAAAPCSLVELLGEALLRWAREATESIVALDASGYLVVPSDVAGERLARALREVETTMDQVSSQGDNPLADRRFARQLTGIAGRIEEGLHLAPDHDAGDGESGEGESGEGDAEGIAADDVAPVPADPEADPATAAIAAGRAACRWERRGDETRAARAWTHCAELWAEVGDEDQAKTARLYATGSLGEGAPIVWSSGDASSSDERVRVRRSGSGGARFGWLRNREPEEPAVPMVRRSRHAVAARQEIDRMQLLAPFIADLCS